MQILSVKNFLQLFTSNHASFQKYESTHTTKSLKFFQTIFFSYKVEIKSELRISVAVFFSLI